MELDKKINIVLNTIFFIFEKYTVETWPILDSLKRCTVAGKISLISFKNLLFTPYLTIFVIFIFRKFNASPIVISWDMKETRRGKKSQIMLPF